MAGFTSSIWPPLFIFYVMVAKLSFADIVTQSRPPPSEAFTHSAAMDEFNNYHLYWKFDEKEITFEIQVKTLGWIGFGFSPNGGMLASDILMAWVKDGVPYLQDRYAEVDKAQPTIDPQQDWVLLMGKEEQGYTVIKVKRKKITCDERDFKITEDTVRIIYAWNDADPADENSPVYHGALQRGSRSSYLLEYGSINAQTSALETTHTWELRIDNVTIPAEQTTYWCQLFKVPSFDKKMHVTRIDALVNKNNTGVVHHVVVYACSKRDLSHITSYSARCREKDMPVDLRNCWEVVFAWAIGGMDYSFPDGVGYPLGGDEEAHYIILEMHYDNPQRLSNIVDSSGLLLHYTYDYRQHEASTALVGEAVFYPPMIIPPNAKNFTIESYCSSDCTTNGIPPEGVYVFSSFLHTHLIGRQVNTRHIRNGKELPELGRDDHYDFNFQQRRTLRKPVLVLPGDEFITTCVYDSTSKKNVTFSGEGTNEEMCLNFMTYYPKAKFKTCLSLTQDFTPVYNYVMEKAMTGDLHIDPEIHKRENKTFYDYLNDIDWTEEEVNKFQKLTLGTHRYREFCSSRGDETDGRDNETERSDAHRYRLVVDEPIVIDDECAKQGESHATRSSSSSVMVVGVVFIGFLRACFNR